MKRFFLIFAIMFLAGSANAIPFLPYEVSILLTKAYVPQGFDNNDQVQIMVEGFLPNTCYRLSTSKVDVNHETKTIKIEQVAFLYVDIPCLQITVPFNTPISVGLLQEGAYKIDSVIVKENKVVKSKTLSTVPIAAAKNLGPDDSMYAIVDDVTLNKSDKELTIAGNLPNNCFEFIDVKVIVESSDVVTILPIIAPNTEHCTVGDPVSFEKHVTLPQLSGRYLVQVRSLNGKSVNKIFEF